MEKERVADSAFGTLLRRHRLAMGLSQEVLAERARMSVNGIGALERGDRQHPYRETVMLLAKALGLAPAAASEFEAAAARPRQTHRRVDPQGLVADERGSTTNLPYQRTSLVGREADIAGIVSILRENRLVTVTGSGGVGKTRIALAVGDALVADSNAGVWLVELAPVGQGSFVANAVAQALHIQELPNRPVLETLLAYLKQKSSLIILDNCEHVIAEAATVADALLRGCPNLRILATSREPLRIAGEHAYRLPSLAVPTPPEIVGLTAAEATAYPAVVLFAQRAHAIDRGFALCDDNAPIVAEICRWLDGIALAIELAAARVSTMPVRMLSAKLDQRLRILTSGDRTVLPRHQTMRALIDWSYDLLTRPEQRLFERLSVFAGGCTLATARAVYADQADEIDVLALLSSLVDKSLLSVDFSSTEPRYLLLESSRQYAFEKLAARGEIAFVARRHAEAYTDLAERLDRDRDATPDVEWFAETTLEVANWRAAVTWALWERGDVVLGQRLVGTGPGRAITPSEQRRWINVALASVDDGTPKNVAAKLELVAADVMSAFHEWEPSIDSSLRALAIYRQLDDELGAARAQIRAAGLLTILGRVAEAKPLIESTLKAARAIKNTRLVAHGLGYTALGHTVLGEFFEARVGYAEALDLYHAIGAHEMVAVTTMHLAEVEFNAGNAERAVLLATAGLARFRDSSYVDTSKVSASLGTLAAYLIACERWDDARTFAREALDLAHEAQHDVDLAWALQHLVAVAVLPLQASDATFSFSKTAVRLLGYVDAKIAALGSVRQQTEQKGYDQVLTALRGTIGPDELAKLMTEGAALTENEAITSALGITIAPE